MRRLVRVAALAVLVGIALVAALGIVAPWSPSGWFALGSAALVAVALCLREPGPRRGLLLVAGLLFTILGAVRWLGSESGLVRMVTLPAGRPSRWTARIFDEQDVALVGARLLATRWPLSPDERDRLIPAMGAAYAELRKDDVVTPSPVLDTLLGRQQPDAFDALVIEPREPAQPRPGPRTGVIFLHGYAGSHTLECWLVAKAAQAVGAVTVCPATGFSGHWTTPAGTAILRASITYLRQRGVRHVFLAGLSNGARGASLLSPSFAPALAGLMLISGAPSDGSNAGLPTLVLHGSQDDVVSPAGAHAFANRVHASFTEFPGGHFVLLVQREAMRKAMTEWMMAQLGLHP